MLEVLAVILAKIAVSVEIRLLIIGKIAKGNVAFEESIDFPRALDALCVSKNQDFEKHHGLVLWPTTFFCGLLGVEWLKAILFVKIIDGVGNESFGTVVFYPL